jgi:radical S-adenosyl methionine domain-containing protein 2
MKLFETASFHIVKPCNMSCKFCYATFDDMHVKQITLFDSIYILNKLKKAGLQKITFAGGEPLLYKHLQECIVYAKNIDLTTSIITNGSLLTDQWLSEMRPYLDWVGLSVDSLNLGTQQLIGRIWNKKVEYQKLIERIQLLGFKLKINTVVNAYNYNEDMNHFISWANPDRWKVFQALRVKGQNDKQFDEISVTPAQYESFIKKHKQQQSLVPENNEAMTGSYLLIDPQGRLFENSIGEHTYSRPLQTNSIEDCLSDINLNREMFLKRGGIYRW